MCARWRDGLPRPAPLPCCPSPAGPHLPLLTSTPTCLLLPLTNLQLYKFDPETFGTWCAILRRVPDSVLWLLRFPPYGEARVKAEAAARGVDPARVIFTDVAAKPMHIRRRWAVQRGRGWAGRGGAGLLGVPSAPAPLVMPLRKMAGAPQPHHFSRHQPARLPLSPPLPSRSGVADLFLDTPWCNAHTTGCDVLWGGVPMVTLPLERMASRVAASLCAATGLGAEMVVSSQQEYEDKVRGAGV